ncbi:hypothetical protein QU814_06960 [Providencia rettgeri]|uniref:hypothetical protein n=1 Tax=Providencia TaxID=586 RepID=UPI000D701A2D|nr:MULTISPECIES: hypothetical protein [Providencia]MCL0019013.1 hypothetical protein [Providencia rettgeri]MDM9282929.1 hypothetical protein [Providencia rettgeri]QZY64319.1 hypothetical protein K7H99_19400 [Providencia rettgeri]HEE8951780.1 hypothetical protein [Providencia rettgeri]
MENRYEEQNKPISSIKNQYDSNIKQQPLKIGLYANKGRVVVIDNNSPLLKNLSLDPTFSKEGKAAHELFSWLINKPRIIGETKKSYIASTLPESQFSGFKFHSKQGIFVESFNSPHEWIDGEVRAQAQLADLLLPSGEWHRHYSIVVLPESANDKQIELIRHWLELTGGSLLIVKDKQKKISASTQQLINELRPVEHIELASNTLENHNFQQIITLPPHTISSLKLTDELRKNSQYFSASIKNTNNNNILSLHDIPITETSSWQKITHSIETDVNRMMVEHQLPAVKISYEKNTLKLVGENIIFRQFQLKQTKQVTSRYNEQKQIPQILPILVTENPDELPNQLVVGAITGKLPNIPHIKGYKILEQPKFGRLTLNNITNEWQYIANNAKFKTQSDQFDFIAILPNGQESQPISIQLQTENAPQHRIPGKRIFSVQNPVYHEPQRRYHPTPSDMQIHNIQLAQTHLQNMTDKHMSLTANRWALLNLEITSINAAKSPDIEAIISNKERKILGRIRLTGPDHLPKILTALPRQPNVSAQDWHQQRFTAPLKGEWIQPDINIIITVNGKPIITEETNQYGVFSPNVTLDNHLIVHVDSHSLYQQGHGVYSSSPLSWGKEAATILPIGQFTLYSSPATVSHPSLTPYMTGTNNNAIPFIHPHYDNPKEIGNHTNAQVHWAYNNSQQYKIANNANSDYQYTAIEIFSSSFNNLLLGQASRNHGGGVHEPNVMFHEAFGHGLGLPHTNSQDHNNQPAYPYHPYDHGKKPAYNQSRQYYVTYHSPHTFRKQAIPTMLSYFVPFSSDAYDAFLPHADAYNQKIHQFLTKRVRWQSNKTKGLDIEDGGFAGDGFYQRWDQIRKQWVILTQQNYSKYYNRIQIEQFPHQRDVPIYWIQLQSAKMADNTLHPYSTITVDRTVGSLPANYHNLKTGTGRQFYIYHNYALTVTYATSNGLLTEVLQIPHETSFNIADKGELVQFTIHELNRKKELGQQTSRYSNPNSLANRLLAKRDGYTLPPHLLLDNYWQGAPIFWATTEEGVVDFSTGKINIDKITSKSALCAKWVENGRLHQQYFSLSDPFGQDRQVDTSMNFIALNHLNTYKTGYLLENTIHHQMIETPLIADINIEQQIDISDLNLSNGQHSFWVTLVTSNEQKQIQEKVPVESWYFSVQQNQLTIKGTIDSTPGLKLDGILIHIDQHLQDHVAPKLIWLQQNNQNPTGQLAENIEFLDYNRPVVFNSGSVLPELISSIPEEEPSSFYSPTMSIPQHKQADILLSA